MVFFFPGHAPFNPPLLCQWIFWAERCCAMLGKHAQYRTKIEKWDMWIISWWWICLSFWFEEIKRIRKCNSIRSALNWGKMSTVFKYTRPFRLLLLFNLPCTIDNVVHEYLIQNGFSQSHMTNTRLLHISKIMTEVINNASWHKTGGGWGNKNGKVIRATASHSMWIVSSKGITS